MVDESIQDSDQIEHWLRGNFEPFAVYNDRVYMKRMVNVERDDKASEVLGEPSERTTEVEVEDVDSGGA
jgi:hypothetical protein